MQRFQSDRGRSDVATGSELAHDAEELHAAVSALVRLYQFRDRDRIGCHGVTQCYALETLVESGPSRSRALADTLMLDKSTVTRSWTR